MKYNNESFLKPKGKELDELKTLISEAKKDKLILKHKTLLNFYITPTELEERIEKNQSYFKAKMWRLASPSEYLDQAKEQYHLAI